MSYPDLCLQVFQSVVLNNLLGVTHYLEYHQITAVREHEGLLFAQGGIKPPVQVEAASGGLHSRPKSRQSASGVFGPRKPAVRARPPCAVGIPESATSYRARSGGGEFFDELRGYRSGPGASAVEFAGRLDFALASPKRGSQPSAHSKLSRLDQ